MPRPPGTCIDCGGPTSSNRAQRCRPCKDIFAVGPNSPVWKGGKRDWRTRPSSRGICIDCGGVTTSSQSQRCRPCNNTFAVGPNNNNWKGGPNACIDCGNPTYNRGSMRCRACGFKHRSGPNSSAWKGGRFPTDQGYIQIWLDPEHPYHTTMHVNGNYVLEHRIVMAESLGRPLKPEETIHHINGKRDDNRLENLQLRSSNHGPGQAMACLDCGSSNIVPAPLAEPAKC